MRPHLDVADDVANVQLGAKAKPQVVDESHVHEAGRLPKPLQILLCNTTISLKEFFVIIFFNLNKSLYTFVFVHIMDQ